MSEKKKKQQNICNVLGSFTCSTVYSIVALLSSFRFAASIASAASLQGHMFFARVKGCLWDNFFGKERWQKSDF